MSRSIDERVVQMRFDNAQFERGIQASMRSLEEFKRRLDFSKSGQSLRELENAANGTNLSPLIQAVESLTGKFSVLGIAGMTAIQRITNSAIDAGEALIKNLSTDQISAGWTKYGEKVSSVQTIMAATAKDFTDTGVQMEYVNSQLDKLNWFTDETSYNFLDMVNNIGKFTSNAIKLDVAVTSMQGIANWAAISGANANEASRAMYNLSQAISVGAVKLIDWRSIENANMGTAAFKETVMETAVEVGTLTKTTDGLYKTMKGTTVSVKDFSSALSEGWFNSKVLLDSLEKYGAATNRLQELTDEYKITTSELIGYIDDYIDGSVDMEKVSNKLGVTVEEADKILSEFNDETMQFGLKAFKAAQEAKTFEEAINSVKDAVSTGWMQTFELIFGDYMEAKEFWTDLANTLYEIFAEAGNARNEMLEEWADADGRVEFIEGLYNALAALLNILTPIKRAWNQIFGAITSSGLLSWTTAFRTKLGNLAVFLEKHANQLQRIFAGLFAAIDILKIAITSLIKEGFNILNSVLGVFGLDVLELLARIGDLVVVFRNWVKESNVVQEVIRAIIIVMVEAIALVSQFIKALAEFGPVKAIIQALGNIFTDSFQGLGGIFTALYETIKWFFDRISKFGMPKNFDEFKQLIDDLRATAVEKLEEIGISFEGLYNVIDMVVGDVLVILKLLGSGFVAAAQVAVFALHYLFGEASKLDWNSIILAGIGVGMLATVWRLIDALIALVKALKPVASTLNALTGTLNALGGMFTSIGKYFDALKADIQSNLIIKLAAAITVLTVSFMLLAQLDWGQIERASVAMVAVVSALGGLAFIASKAITVIPGLTQMLIGFSAAILIMVVAFDMLNTGGIETLITKIVTLGILIAALGGLAVVMEKFAPSLSMSTSTFIAMAAGIWMVAVSISQLGKMDMRLIFSALPVTAAVLAVILAFMSIVALVARISGGNAIKSHFGTLLGASASMYILAASIQKFGKMNPAVLSNGIVAMTEIMVLFAGLMVASMFAGRWASKAGAMILKISIAMLIFKPAIENLASLSLGTIVKGGAVLEAIMVLLAGIIAISSLSGENAAKAGLLILAVAGAVAVLQLAVKTLGAMDVAAVTKGTVAVAALVLALGYVVKGAAATDSVTKGLIKLTAVAVVLTTLVAILALMNNDADNAIKAALGLAAVLVASGVFLKFAQALGDFDWMDLLKTLAMLAGTIVVVGLVLSLLSNVTDPSTVIPLAIGVSAVLLAISASMWVLAKAGPALAAAGESAAGILKLLGVIGIVLGVIAAIGVVVGIIDQYTNGAVADVMNRAVGIMLDLGTAIGNFFGGIVGGLAGGTIEAVASALPAIGQHLSDFMMNAEAFFEGVTALGQNGTSMTAVLADLIGALVLMVGADMVSVVAAITGGSIGALSSGAVRDSFVGFGETMRAFANSLGDIDYSNVESAVNAGKMLFELENNLPTSLVNFDGTVPDESGLEAFGTRIKAFGAAMKEFGETVDGMKTESIDNAITAGTMLSELELSLAPIGPSLRSFIFGTKSLDDFGSRIQSFGKAMIGFAHIVSGLKQDAVKNAVTAGKSLAALEDSLPTQGGALQWFFFGTQDLRKFGERIKEFAKGIRGFSDELSNAGGIDIPAVNAAIRVGKTLAELEGMLNPQGGVTGFWFGDSSLKQFGSNLRYFASEMVYFSDQIASLDFSILDNAIEYIRHLIGVDEITEGVTDLALQTQTLFNELMSVILANADDYNGAGFKLGKEIIDGYKKALENNETSAAAATRNTATKLMKSFSSKLGEIGNYIEMNKEKYRAAGNDMGKWIVEGFKIGIDNNMTSAKASMTSLANTAIKAFNERMEIASPSAVMKRAGVWIVKGLGEGIDVDTTAEEAAKKKADNIVAAFSTIGTRIQNAIKDVKNEYKIWQLTDAKKLKEDDPLIAEKELKYQVDLLDQYIQESYRLRSVMLLMAREYGESSDNYINAYHDWQDSYISALEQQSKVDELQQTDNKNIKDAIDKSMKLMQQYHDIMIEAGKTEAEIAEFVRKRSGLDQFEEFGGKPAAKKYDTDAMMANIFGEQEFEEVEYLIAENAAIAAKKGTEKGTKEGTSKAASSKGVTDAAESLGNSIGNSITDGLTDNLTGSGREVDKSNFEKALEEFLSEGTLDTDAIFGKIGENGALSYLTSFADAAETTFPSVSETFGNIADSLSGLFNKSDESSLFGTNFIQGFLDGAQSLMETAKAKMQSFGQMLASAFSFGGLQERSPSKLTFKAGQFFDQGFINGVDDLAGDAREAVKSLGNSTVGILQEAANRVDQMLTEDYSPVITPVLDLDQVSKQASGIQGLLGSPSTSFRSANAILSSRNYQFEGSTSGGQNGSSGGTVYSFTQNNYSPKALSSAEIYRKTRSQFAQLKGETKR